MKNDIDFDELDKAVTSLMGTIPPGKQADETTDEDQQKVLAISPTLQPDEAPAYSKLDEAAKKIGSETLMTDTDQTTIVETPVARVLEKEPEVAAAPDVVAVPSPAPTITPPERPRVMAIPRPSTGRFMDVVAPSQAIRPSVPPPVPVLLPVVPRQSAAEDPVTAPVDTSEPSAASNEDIALTTPFLPDAKVEKRPLGGSVQGAATAPLDDDSSLLLQSSDLLAPEAPSEPELTEYTEDEEAVSPKSQGDQPVLDATDFQGQSSVEAEIQAIESAAADKLSPDMHESVRMVESSDTENMIAAQKSSTTEDVPGAIYDVNAYHQPIDTPTKQKSGWCVVVIIVIIIVLAALLGGGAYLVLNLGA